MNWNCLDLLGIVWKYLYVKLVEIGEQCFMREAIGRRKGEGRRDEAM